MEIRLRNARIESSRARLEHDSLTDHICSAFCCRRIAGGTEMPTNVALTGLARDLAARGESGKPIRIGLVGSGEMGTDIVARVAHMPGIEIGAISELNMPNAVKAVEIAYGSGDRVAETKTGDELNRAIESGQDRRDLRREDAARERPDRRRRRRHRRSRGRRRDRPRRDGARQAPGDDERRGRHHHRRLPALRGRPARRDLQPRRRRRALVVHGADRVRLRHGPPRGQRRQGQEQPAEHRRHPATTTAPRRSGGT